MDVLCPRCAEPWDIDEFHAMAAELGSTFTAVIRDFQRRGCIATGYVTYECEREADDGTGLTRSAAAAAVYDLLGDDVDGAAAMLEDAEYLGMFE